MKLTNKVLKQLIKEAYDDFLKSFKDSKEDTEFLALAGSFIDTVIQDPDIPPEHKQKLINLWNSGTEGRRQAQELIRALGYGVETYFNTPGTQLVRNPNFRPDIPPETVYQGREIISIKDKWFESFNYIKTPEEFHRLMNKAFRIGWITKNVDIIPEDYKEDESPHIAQYLVKFNDPGVDEDLQNYYRNKINPDWHKAHGHDRYRYYYPEFSLVTVREWGYPDTRVKIWDQENEIVSFTFRDDPKFY